MNRRKHLGHFAEIRDGSLVSREPAPFGKWLAVRLIGLAAFWAAVALALEAVR